MPQFIEITSLDHPGCEVYTKLTEAQLRNRLEPEKGIFIAESPKVIRLALERGYELISILTEKRCLGRRCRRPFKELRRYPCLPC